MDDTCTVVPKERVQDLLIHLNGIEESIQFTCEMESNGCLPFLDVLMSRQPDGSIRTSVYRKGTHTDHYLDYNSHHPLSHKRSVASTLKNRAHTHSSTTSSLKQLHKWWVKLNNLHPTFGYFTNPSKTWLIVKEKHLSTATQRFLNTGVNITTEGKRHLGAALASSSS